MTSRDPEGAGEAVRSAILATVWVLDYFRCGHRTAVLLLRNTKSIVITIIGFSCISYHMVQSRFAETRFAETPTLTLTPIPNHKP